MSKVLLVIIGNIASGKSTLINTVKERVRGFVFYSIDQYRSQYKAIDPTTDKRAWDLLIKDVSNTERAIVECSGTSKYFDTLINSFSGKVVVIKIECSVKTCIQREKLRIQHGYIKPLFSSYDIEESIRYIDGKLNDIYSDYSIDGEQSNEEVSKSFFSLPFFRKKAE